MYELINKQDVLDMIERLIVIEHEYMKLPFVCKSDLVTNIKEMKPNAVIDQIRWERDIAFEQLEELGSSFGRRTWIPVEVDLPKTDDYVLCWYEYRIMSGTHCGEMKQTYGIGWYYEHSKHWVGDVSTGVDTRVIAWMPLPKEYAIYKDSVDGYVLNEERE